jgi:hypothetical protein
VYPVIHLKWKRVPSGGGGGGTLSITVMF